MRRARTTAAVLLLVAVAAACSKDDGGAASTTSTTTATSSTSASTATSAAAADCPAPATTTGTLDRTMTIDGTQRHYLLAVPSSYDGTRPVPLVFTFHGLGSNSRQQLLYSRWGQLGETKGFLTVSPDALGSAHRWDFIKSASDPTSDAAFIHALITEIERTYCVDADRVYSSGMSNGSAVTYGLACRHEEPFAAYGSVAATFYIEAYCGKAPPTSLIYFHGTKDPVVPYDGGKVSVDAGESVNAAPAVMAEWATHDGCADPATSNAAADVRLTHWTACADGSEIAFYSVVGGGHTWPGSIPVPRLGATTDSIDATALMWAFFQAHPRRA